MYKEWPNGHLPKELQRPELDVIKKMGYDWEDPHDIVTLFEEKVAKFAGSEYAIAVDSCSNALFLSLKYMKAQGVITIPAHTYISVPMQIKHAGCNIAFTNSHWKKQYRLFPYDIWDAATMWEEGMYAGGLQCISFQIKKQLPIGKGGMILTSNEEAWKWLKTVCHDGRTAGKYVDMDFPFLGWHMNMTPEDAARGIILMDSDQKMEAVTTTHESYTDISQHRIFK